MSNNKQSSVDWLVKKINDIIDFIPMNKWDEIRGVVQQAKEMHKEEITRAWRKGDGLHDKVAEEMSLKYYNETFNTEI